MRERVEPLPMERADIRRTQQLLALLGYAPGPVDGFYGPRTRGAIERFEEARGLPVSGTVSPALIERLALEL
jgi:peptidoglycan hydrolase-like protein with peptidoglycan-binding domain